MHGYCFLIFFKLNVTVYVPAFVADVVPDWDIKVVSYEPIVAVFEDPSYVNEPVTEGTLTDILFIFQVTSLFAVVLSDHW